ncbi:MAG: hypothetical protein PHZ28_04595, partial [Candidatus Izemoplasmatales bacterium]|nr:hypothetical protein [Candidatus Izemoplasmatales bacterium]
MKRFKLILIFIMSSFVIILTGCISQGNPVYVDSILVYQNGELLEGTLKYYDGSKWVDYDNEKVTKEKMYYSFDITDQNIKVVFNVFAPNTILTDLKLVTNTNLNYSNNETVFISDEIVQEGSTFACTFEFEFTSVFNTISVTGFATTDGLKYMGAKGDHSNFVLYRVYFN